MIPCNLRLLFFFAVIFSCLLGESLSAKASCRAAKRCCSGKVFNQIFDMG